tara:strand:+ start:1068 stop:1838 length:771 start_codon:yes stop_codon:yes gene_type:complete
MKNLKKDFNVKVENLNKVFKGNIDSIRIESFVEQTRDYSLYGCYNQVLDWYDKAREDARNTTIEEIPLEKCKSWKMKEGSFVHDSGEFFKVNGVRVKNTPEREIGSGGWDQPFLTQKGYDGGILGVLRSYHDGIPHYLVEAKFEPGNYNLIQISPTVQATFSNINKAHKGNAPKFVNFFLEDDISFGKVTRQQWLSEDGGRLFNKRNKGMIVEKKLEDIGTIPANFYWVSLWQIKKMILEENAIISPHIRSLISML